MHPPIGSPFFVEDGIPESDCEYATHRFHFEQEEKARQTLEENKKAERRKVAEEAERKERDKYGTGGMAWSTYWKLREASDRLRGLDQPFVVAADDACVVPSERDDVTRHPFGYSPPSRRCESK